MNIKFRGAVIIPFPNKTARWAYGSLVTLKGEAYIVPDDAEVDETGEILDGLVEVHPESVGQWTGESKWEEGKRTVGYYENDIVEVRRLNVNCHLVLVGTGVIRFDAGCFGICFIENNIDGNKYMRFPHDNITVIGNTTDNPELSKGETQ